MSTPKPKPKLSYKAQSFPSSDKPFECTACQLYFRRLHDLKRHERLHTGERPYCCNNCRRTFARLDALKRHLSAESNVHCSDWTYQPGLVSGLNRPTIRSHQRSISLPYVQNTAATAVRINTLDSLDSAEQTLTPSPQDHSSFHHSYHHRQLQSSPEPHILKHVEGEESFKHSPPRAITDPEYHCRQDRHHWGSQVKGSSPKLNIDNRPPGSDITMEEDVSLSHSRPHTSPTAKTIQQLSPVPQSSYPQSYYHHHQQQQQLPHSYSHPNSHHMHQPLSPFNKDQTRQRRDSYPVSPRSSLSPSPSPILSPSPSSMSASSMSSPTNMWSNSKAPDAFDTASRRSSGSSHYRHESWQHRSESFSFPQRTNRQELPPFKEEESNYDRHHPREYERRPGPSLASILNSPLPSNSSYPPMDQTTSAPMPTPVPTFSRPQHLHHSHSQSYSHPQQHHHHHNHSHIPHQQHSNENDHCCEAMIEIQKLRQELQWVSMQYRNLSEKTQSESISSGSSGSIGSGGNNFNNSLGNASGDRSATLV